MQKATATYRAPPGDSKVCEMGGVSFTDGKSVELNSYDHAHMITALHGNPHFDITVGEDDKKPPTVEKKRGRPSNADIAAAKALAEKTEADAKEAAAKAKEAKEDAEAITKDAAKPTQQPTTQHPVAPPTPPHTPPSSPQALGTPGWTGPT
jgi:hypothetical protein